MTTAHEFARDLLDGPDLPIGLMYPKEREDEDISCRGPIVTETDGGDLEGNPIRVLIIEMKP